MSDLANTNLDRVPTAGGSVKVTLSSNSGQGNDGTSLPCKQVWVQADDGNSKRVWINIGSAATYDATGMVLPYVGDSDDIYYPLNIPIDDVSKLYFSSEDDNAVLYILYTK